MTDDTKNILSRNIFGDRANIQVVIGKIYGDEVYIRGLIKFTNYCRNKCYYCGIRRGNHNITRYRLSKEEILTCCEEGYQLGFRAYVLQGGEDPYYTDTAIIRETQEM